MKTTREKAELFMRQHEGAEPLVLPNAWDPGSAIMLSAAGFTSLATTSSGIAFSQGLPDGQRMSRDRMLELCAAIAASVDAPVSGDLEAGYGPDPEDVAATVAGAVDAGLVGCNIEDGTGSADEPLLDVERAVERIRAGAEAARGTDLPFVLNARTDAFLAKVGSPRDQLRESIGRANAYREAGAGCLFVPGVLDLAVIAELVREIDGPLNILIARAGTPAQITVADLAAIGVRRITIGGSLAVAALALVRDAAQELRAHGTVHYTGAQLTNADVNALMAGARDAAAA